MLLGISSLISLLILSYQNSLGNSFEISSVIIWGIPAPDSFGIPSAFTTKFASKISLGIPSAIQSEIS